LGQALLDAADRGVTVLVLCPAVCDLPLGRPRPARMSFESAAMIKKLAPKLSADMAIKSHFVPSGDYDHAVLACSKQAEGWPWVEMEYAPGKGKLCVCGCEMIKKWEDSPTPRYFFRTILEELTKSKKNKN